MYSEQNLIEYIYIYIFYINYYNKFLNVISINLKKVSKEYGEKIEIMENNKIFDFRFVV